MAKFYIDDGQLVAIRLAPKSCYSIYHSKQYGYLYDREFNEDTSQTLALEGDWGKFVESFNPKEVFDYEFCTVCNDYRKIQYDMTECSHLFMAQPINIWTGGGCTENKPYFRTLIWTELKELVQTIGCAEDLEKSINLDSYELDGSVELVENFILNNVSYYKEMTDVKMDNGWAVLMSAIGTAYNDELLAMLKTIPTPINYDITIDEKTYHNVSLASAKRMKSVKEAWDTVIIKPNYGEYNGTLS